MRVFRTLMATMVLVLAVSAVSAQGTGGLKVQVVDSNGDPLPGATVTLSHNAGNLKPYAELTDQKGWAEFPVLRPGDGYVIDVMFPGFATRHQEDIRVPIGAETTIPVQLSEELVERVKVVATQDVVELESTSSTSKFSDEFIQDLPVPGRFYQNVLTLAPGVQDADGDGNPNVHGSRSRDFKAVVSGVSNVDPLTGQQMGQVNPNSIAEMQVITGGAGAEFGRAQGGFANIIQKQGTNEFEGVFEFYYRTSKFDGDGAGDSSTLPEVEFDWYQPSGQVSGPLVRDKLWYRLSHELIDQSIPVPVGGAGLETIEVEQWIHSDQVTWQVSPRNKIAFQYQYDPLTVDGFGVSNLTPKDSALILETGTDTLQLTWTAPYSPKVLIETTTAWQNQRTSLSPTTQGIGNSCVEGLDFLEQAQCFNADTTETTGSNPRTQSDRSQRLTVSSKGTLYGGNFWGMNHTFKFGLNVENERYYRDRTDRPNLFFFRNDDPDDGGGSPEPKAVIVANLSIPENTTVRNTGTNWGLFLEDQIKPLNNLVVTLGARLEREEINSNGKHPFDPVSEQVAYNDLFEDNVDPSAIARQVFTSYEDLDVFISELSRITGLSSTEILVRLAPITRQSAFWSKTRVPENINIINTNFSPRLGVSWDPWSNGKTKFALTAGRYYDKVILGIPLLELNAPTTNLVFDAIPNDDFQWVITGQRNSVNPAVNVQGVNRDLSTPYQDEWRFVFERELWTETALKVEYIRRKYRDQLQDYDSNRFGGDFGRCTLDTPTTDAIVPVNPGDPAYDPDLAPGDGIPDDCVGDIDRSSTLGGDSDLFDRNSRLERPDGIQDLYLQNPAWGNYYIVDNINSADYEGVVVELIRRQYRSWEMQSSYTWSTVEGNGEDFGQQIGDDSTTIDDEVGYQSYDQRHVVKVSATTITPWGFRLGGVARWQSGVPYSVLLNRLSFDNVPPSYGGLGTGNPSQSRFTYPSHQRNDQRNVPYWTFDLRATKEMNLGRGLNVQFAVEVFNLLNDGTYRVYNSQRESGRQINGVNEAEPLFGRRWQLGLKMAF